MSLGADCIDLAFSGNQSSSISIFPFWTIEMEGKKNMDRCAAGIKISEDLMLLPLGRHAQRKTW